MAVNPHAQKHAEVRSERQAVEAAYNDIQETIQAREYDASVYVHKADQYQLEIDGLNARAAQLKPRLDELRIQEQKWGMLRYDWETEQKRLARGQPREPEDDIPGR